jgi:replicative DNA helicase
MSLDNVQPMNIIKQAEERAKIVQDASKETRIPTGFAEIDKLMYGGFSTIEDFILVVARTNTGKSWLMTKMMESAQKAGYNVAYYSPEMRAEYIGTRFDSWRAHFKNSDLYQGKYTDDYSHYLKNLENETADAFIIEDKDMPGGVTVQKLSMFVKRHGIKLLIIDGLSYMTDSQKSTRDYEKYKHISEELFVLSKTYRCAVVVTMQANRDTKDMVDEKGVPFPNLYSIEGSDVPARVATQVFTVRQIFDQHVLDIRLEKSRNAKNEKPVLSYSWDVNTGNVQYIPGDVQINNSTISPVQDNILTDVQGPADDLASLELEDQDVEF